ncbi:MAG: hypothetical protein M1272_01705 [Firmicutes bacterium]|nr:hypothetical protein [Bacillota bacterium]
MPRDFLIEGTIDLDETPLQSVRHECRKCQMSFPYHYDGSYTVDHLTDIDFICDGCLASFLQDLEAKQAIA